MASYWENRLKLRYYQKVVEMSKKHAPDAKTVLDVGSSNCQYITWLDWIATKTAIDLRTKVEIEGVLSQKIDFMNFTPPISYDLVLCLQVLEHLREPAEFCHKLLRTGKTVIISVPYKWKSGRCSSHIQDPVDEGKLLEWIKVPVSDFCIVADKGLRRLIVVVQGVVGSV